MDRQKLHLEILWLEGQESWSVSRSASSSAACGVAAMNELPDSIDLEVARLERLGAKIVSRNGWVVIQAPSEHRFCVGSPYRSGFDQGAEKWQGA